MCGKGVVGVDKALGSLSGRPDQSGLNPGCCSVHPCSVVRHRVSLVGCEEGESWQLPFFPSFNLHN